MSPEKIWFVTAGPGSISSRPPSDVQTGYFAKYEYEAILGLQKRIAKIAQLPAPAEEIGIWKTHTPEAWPVSDVISRTIALPSNEEELPKLAVKIKDFDVLFNRPLKNGCIHIIAWISDITAETRDKLVAMNEKLFNAITLKVDSYENWTKNDVVVNGAKFGTVKQISDFQERLNEPRAHDDDLITNIRAKCFVEELKLQFSEIKEKRGADKFDHYFVPNQATKHWAVVGASEFENFSCMRTVCEDFAFDSREEGRHSEEEAGHFCTFFVQRPCRSLRRHNIDYKYSQGLQWPFSIYLEYEEVQDNNKRKRDTKKYSPKSDFRVDGLHGFPQLIGEVVSEPDYSDKWRMLLQSIAIVRAVTLSDLSGDFFVMAIYVDDNYVAWRYLVYKIKEGKAIYLALKEFDLKIVMQCRRLLLEIYNFLDYIKDFGKGKGNAPLLSDVKKDLKALNKAGLKFKSLHSKNPKGSGSKASRKRSGRTEGES